MTIDKAIEILLDLLHKTPRFSPFDNRNAIELGIEALKRLKEHREDHIDITFRALPGETEK